MSGIEPNTKERAERIGLEEDLSVDDVALLSLSQEPNERPLKVTVGGELSANPIDQIPTPGPILLLNPVSGRYKSQGAGYQLELRVDVDGKRPMSSVSGDYYQVSGSTITYSGSFIINPISISVTSSAVTIQGSGKFTWSTSYTVIKVTIPRTTIFVARAPATVIWYNTSGGQGTTYVCPFVSIYFRTVQYELDKVSDLATPVFSSYNTGSLPSGGPARVLSVPAAYAEAGIEMQTAGIWDTVPISETGADAKWSDAELHAAMVKHFSLWADVPQWKVWQLAAQLHELGPGLYGIMFDQQGKQRQGCAVFHTGIGGTTSDKLRLQLYTYVHELGHCFNLLHSWQKSYAQPPAPNRPDAKSWMNYPWNYPGGDIAFWNAFAFQFDDLEVTHLRHAFRNNIIIGGNDFEVGSALTDPEAFSRPIVDNSGLKLELRARNWFSLGEPVVVEIKLSTTDLRGVQVHSHLHPNMGFVQIGIQNPSGHVEVYEPLIEHCMAPDLTTLNADQPSIYDSAFISYGKGGLYFDKTGPYKLRALYYSLDGSLVASNTLNIRVRTPHSDTDEEVADLFLDDEQGTLLYLLGSDSEFLKNGNVAFDTVLNDYSDHPLAVYANLVKGSNAGRAFKSITLDKKITVRPPMYKEAIAQLSDVVDSSEKGEGVDNITLSMTMLRMANYQKASGNLKNAKETAEHMLDIFGKKSLKPHIMNLIEAQARTI
jgi:hypothetical protein